MCVENMCPVLYQIKCTLVMCTKRRISCFLTAQGKMRWGDLLRFVPCAIVWHAKIIFFSHKDTAKSIIYVWHIYTTYRKSISVKLPDFLSWGKKYIVFWLCHTIAMLFQILKNYLFLWGNYKKKLYESWIKEI